MDTTLVFKDIMETYKDSVAEKRCLILADGFFEPHHENGQAIPYFCSQPSKAYPEGDLFLFAGLYTELNDNTLTTTILTTEANPFFMEVHNKGKRMPLILDNMLLEDWLDDGLNTQSINELMATGFTNNSFKAHCAGTILATGLAVARGWAINLGGGMHHASSAWSVGWCPYSDIYLALR